MHGYDTILEAGSFQDGTAALSPPRARTESHPLLCTRRTWGGAPAAPRTQVPHEYTAKVWGEAEVPRGRTALTEEPGIGYTGGAWSYWSK